MTGPAVSAVDTLPCGCRHWLSSGQFFYVPCKPSCRYYQYALRTAAEQGKPVVVRRA